MTKARGLADLGNAYSDGALSNRNLIINGAMQVAQRGTSVTGITSNGYYVCDRWQYRNGSGGTGQEATHDQSTDSPAGFYHSYKIACTVADATPTGSENEALGYKIEGSDLAALQYGTSSAKPMTLSFWVKSTVTGDYGVQFLQALAGTDNSALKSYTINTASTWEYKTITLDGNTAESLLTDNSLGMSLFFHLACGPDDQTAAYDWTADNSFKSITGQANVFASTSDSWQITGVQLEVGDTATPFEHRSYGDELQRCQRYYQAGGVVYFRAYQVAGAYAGQGFEFKNTMRATPTFAFGGDATWSTTNITGDPIVSPESGSGYLTYALWNASGDGRFQNTSTSYFTFDAEL